MKIGMTVLGGVLVLTGIVWFLQGVGILGGSFMTGQASWLVIGLVVGAAGFVVLWRGLR